MSKAVLFQAIQFSISSQLHVKTLLFQTIQFNICTLFNSIWPIHRSLSGDTTPGKSGPESDGNKSVLHILPCASITGASASDNLESYPGNSLGGVLLLCRNAVGAFFSTSPFIQIRRGKQLRMSGENIALRSTLARSGITWLGPIYALNRTKLCTCANWIVWNGIVF